MTGTRNLRTFFLRLIDAALLCAVLAQGCARKEERQQAPPPARPAASAPTTAEAENATLHGLEGDAETVTLVDGRWSGPPYVAGGASRPSVYLVPGFLVTWNTDGEGPAESVVLAAENSGGSGEYIYLVVIAREGAGVVNRATALLGDRVQVVSVEPSGRRLKMTVVRAGPEGALCCPDEVAAEEWELREGTLQKLPGSTPPHPLTLDFLSGVEWTLVTDDDDAGRMDEPPAGGGSAPVGLDNAATNIVTLRYGDGKFQGHSGCNRYFTGVSPGELPGDLTLGPVASTRMACPDSAANAAESLYLARLGSVNRFGFSACRLMLQYEGEAGSGVLYYRRP